MNCFGEVIFYSFQWRHREKYGIRKIVSGTSEYNFKRVFAVYWAFVIANIQNDSSFQFMMK